jgi:hypothetical protein
MTCSHLPQGEHESLNAAEELTWMLTLFGHRHFSDSNEMEQTNKSKLKRCLHIQGQEAKMYMNKNLIKYATSQKFLKI